MIEQSVRDLTVAFTQVLDAAQCQDAEVAPFLEAVRSIDANAARPHTERNSENPVLGFLPQAVRAMQGDLTLAEALRKIIPQLSWGSTYSDRGPGAAVATRMCWAEIVGANGLVRRPDIRFGCFLLGPGLLYPPHGHEAPELYYVISGGMQVELGFDGARRLVVAPGYSVTPAGEAHALNVGDDPLLILYCWTGNVSAPVWWFERTVAGGWMKIYPEIVRTK